MKANIALVRGVGSHNGGAELLLRAASGHLSDHWTVIADRRKVSHTVRHEWQIGNFLEVPRFGALRSLGWNAAPRSLARAMNNYSERHVDALFDASGFFLGDQWSSSSISRDGQGFEYLAKRQRPIVMLPQAFGPFEKTEVATSSRLILDRAELIYARDRVSLEYIKELLDDDSRVRLAPDITIALETNAATSKTDHVAIVPNVNIPARAKDPSARERYVQSLASIARGISGIGLEPVLLAHSAHGDPILVNEIRKLVPQVRERKPENGLAAKQFIGTCHGVIAGRYHAIVSALAQGVPAVAHSWSHKYGELLEDFGVSDGLADPYAPTDSVDLLAGLIESDSYNASLRANKPLLVNRIERMWEEVDHATSGMQ
ncbi:polysaccharide pyruvyl transferase family protein [Microbacterium aurantiacum]|uniref:Polysaccharide pyruvyl transferase family protein n=1 Tax=Microbacterium aurantiacum TaxID=162393 RepID=A0AAJ2HAZ7_9MICO|nr:polysaccharide pyruvyl transferase family protein [Microbacterium aurantiacum]MDS0244245.1 polysaccharide pyruvyl transferase family protein [Microbacterium aurantiacum]